MNINAGMSPRLTEILVQQFQVANRWEIVGQLLVSSQSQLVNFTAIETTFSQSSAFQTTKIQFFVSEHKVGTYPPFKAEMNLIPTGDISIPFRSEQTSLLLVARARKFSE